LPHEDSSTLALGGLGRLGRNPPFSFAAMGWFFSPLVFVLTTLMVVAILYSREFRSEVLDILKH
jgi:uncharacterized membrane protein